MKLKIMLLSFFLVGVFSCRITLVPAYDAGIEDQITQGAKLNDVLYLEMLEKKESDRKYELFSAKYLEVESEINSILLKTQAREKNQNLLAMVNNLQTLFKRFKDDHKSKGVLKDADIQLNQVQIRAAWAPLLVAEKALSRQK